MDASTITPLPAELGTPLQGGIYAGPIIENGQLVHLIAASEDLGEHEWKDAKKAASDYRGGGFDDWFLPEQPHLMVAWANNKAAFEPDYYWSATPYGEGYAWRVGFEHGGVDVGGRSSEFRVRPFRRLSI